jgi:glycosyltransferase involved in cell wall biosynthesis
MKVPQETAGETRPDQPGVQSRSLKKKAGPAKKKPTGLAAMRRRIAKKSRHKVIVWRTRARRALAVRRSRGWWYIARMVRERTPASELPLVSVGFPVYNGGSRFRKALDALIAQTYPNIEIIISDNCSTDGTGVVAESYCKRHSHIRYYRNTSNIGAPLNFQRTLDLARGEYFMWAADDDLWEPTFVAKIMEGLLADPEYVTGFCQLSKFRHSDGALIQKLRQPPQFGSGTSRAVDQMTYLRERCQWMALGIHRIDVLRKIVRLRSDSDCYQGFFDVYVPFRLLGYGRPYIVREILFHDGRHDQSMTMLRYQGKLPARMKAPRRHLLRVSQAILCDSTTSRGDRLRILRHVWRSRAIKWGYDIHRATAKFSLLAAGEGDRSRREPLHATPDPLFRPAQRPPGPSEQR